MKILDIFPGFLYIGDTLERGLHLKVPAGAKGVRFAIFSEEPGFLNVNSISLLQKGRNVSKEVLSDVRISSAYEENNESFGDISVAKGRGVHTQYESMPWLEMMWNGVVDEVLVLNREDEYGSRANFLRIYFFVEGKWRLSYVNDGVDKALELLKSYAKHVSLENIFEGGREVLAKTVINKINKEKEFIYFAGEKLILPLVSVFKDGDSLDLELLSYYYAYLILQGKSISSGLIRLSNKMLRTRKSLDEFELAVSSVLSKYTEEKYSYTKHGMRAVGILSKRSSKYISAMKLLISDLKEFGVDVFLCYGTLLGAVREKDFIPHDDDVDLAYVGKRGGEDDSERQSIIEYLKSKGYEISFPKTKNFHVIKDGVALDLFPTWKSDDGLLMYMEGMRVRNVDGDLIFPLGSVDFKGEVFPAPADKEGFLRDRYGDNWHIPDKYADWIYPLQEDA